MPKKAIVAAVLAVLCVLFALAVPARAQEKPAAPAQAQEKPADPETTTEVPALSDFHEIIYPLWHNAWPNKDFKMMKDLLPEVKVKADAVEKAPLPGILRDKKEQWDEDIQAMKAAVAAYDKAAADNDEQGLLNAVEQLHGSFEAMARLIYPKMKELNAYHVVLYQIYHRYMPKKEMPQLKLASEDLTRLCKALQDAEIPKRFAPKAAQLKEGFAALCAATSELVEAAKTGDVATVQASVDKVHAQYQKVDGLFGGGH